MGGRGREGRERRGGEGERWRERGREGERGGGREREREREREKAFFNLFRTLHFHRKHLTDFCIVFIHSLSSIRKVKQKSKSPSKIINRPAGATS